MGISIRTAVLLFMVIVFAGCSSYHRSLTPSDPPASADNAAIDSESQNSLVSENQDPPVSESQDAGSAKDNPSDSEISDASENAFLDMTLGGSDEDEPKDPEKSAQALLDEALEYYQTALNFQQNGDLDNALDTLDQTYALILKVDSDDDAKLIQQKDDLRILISKRIQEIYTSRYTVASLNDKVGLNHNEIPMDLNEHVKKEIKSFQGSERKDFLAAYKRSGKYRARIVEALEERGMPKELSWLPLIESGFKVRAVSSAQALGLWQFVASTGYKFGLKRNTYVDERMDPEKATEAAIEYLSKLHEIFGDWMTVLAAYNCGEGRVLRVIQSQNVKYLDNFWDLYQRLPLETARYVPRFLAILHIIKNPEEYGFELPELDAPLEYEELSVNRQVSLAGISKEMGVPENELKALNPELRYSLLPAEPYTLRVPPGKTEQLLASINNIPISQPPQNAYTKHRVRSGETLSTIAARYHTSIRKIMLANNLRRSNYIVAGKTLKIPLRGTTVSTASSAAVNPADVPDTHIVRRGDNLWIIAKKYGTTVKRIQALNGLTTTNLTIGQGLKIKETTEAASETDSAWNSDTTSDIDTKNLHTYVVQEGDSPFTIAKKNNTSLERLLQLNHLTKRSTIYPGQTLYLD